MRYIKRYVKSLLRSAYRTVMETEISTDEKARLGLFHYVDQGTQILLRLKYQEMVRNRVPLPPLGDVEFRSYSQNGEDGILLYVFSLIGTTNKKVVEVCVESGVECNAANLIINHGWQGLLFDGSEEKIARGRAFYAKHLDTWVRPPRLVSGWITRDNIDALITNHGFMGDIDLLSIDVDGNDYWIWQSIQCINPRVVVIEHNSPWGAERSVTIPYKEDFVAEFIDGVPEYAGATLPAFVNLGREKGYRLIGVQRLGFNAFFVRKGVGEDLLPEIPAEQCFVNEPIGDALKERLDRLAKRQYVHV